MSRYTYPCGCSCPWPVGTSVQQVYEWTTTDGPTYLFDVMEAYCIIAATPPRAIVHLPASIIVARARDLNAQHFPHVQLQVPGIAVQIQEEGEMRAIVIDGHHRAAAAIERAGADVDMPLLLLTLEETLRCLIGKKEVA